MEGEVEEEGRKGRGGEGGGERRKEGEVGKGGRGEEERVEKGGVREKRGKQGVEEVSWRGREREKERERWMEKNC